MTAAQRRLRECVERWPECESGAYDPRCCRFPKSCSCTSYPSTWTETEPRPESPAATTEELRAALIFWVERARRFEEKLGSHSYMRARGVMRPEFTLGNRIFEESLPTVDEVQGILRDA